jgi:hypothetical protein
VALPASGKARVIAAMSTKSREVIWGGRVSAAKMNAESARHIEVYRIVFIEPHNAMGG